MSEELKPCPFDATHDVEVVTSYHGYVVCCVDCSVTGHNVERTGETQEEAISEWNTRAGEKDVS